MWHFKSKDCEFEVHGTRQDLKEKLNIFMVGFGDGDDYYEEIADVWQKYHWQRICEDYNLNGSDDIPSTTNSI